MSKNKKTIFVGAATALVTPFSGGKIDYPALEKLIEHQIKSSIDALVVAGTTGEASTLTEEEYERLVSFSAEKIGGRVPLIAGSGSNNTEKSKKLTAIAEKNGADACLVVTPYYNKATNRGLFENYKEIAESTSLPIIVYNVPTRTCVNISLDTYKALSKIENIVAVKEASPDISGCAELIFECGDDLDVYTGSDDQIVQTLSLGGLGAISVASNIIPYEIHDICLSYLGGNTSYSKDQFKKYYGILRAMFTEVNPIPVKTALSMLGVCKEEFRLPLCKISDQNRAVLIDKMKEVGLLTYPANG
ncbi:MAG: 4-hydroxy-tetrahydrodipicolinate synthase [Clostridia bacterium]|nr:4-hydroxy-tetrahydrodipicolinate synthase [Clostridia bacterium]